MRYYVLETSDDPEIKMYIVAEVVREIDEKREDRALGIAGQIAGEHALILSGAEILVMGDGTRILREWDEGDDGHFHSESVRMGSKPESKEAVLRHLRLVKTGRTDPQRSD